MKITILHGPVYRGTHRVRSVKLEWQTLGGWFQIDLDWLAIALPLHWAWNRWKGRWYFWRISIGPLQFGWYRQQ